MIVLTISLAMFLLSCCDNHGYMWQRRLFRTDVRKRLVAYSVLLFVAEKIGKNYINPPRFLLSASADRYSPSPLCDPGRNTGTRVTLEATVSARRPWLMALTASLRSRFFCCSQLLSICLLLNKTVRFGVVRPAVVHMLRVLVQKNHKLRSSRPIGMITRHVIYRNQKQPFHSGRLISRLVEGRRQRKAPAIGHTGGRLCTFLAHFSVACH